MFSVHVAHKWLFISPDCHCPYHHIHHHCHHPHHIHHSSSASSFISSPSSPSFIYKEKMGMDMLGLSMTNKPIHLHHLLFLPWLPYLPCMPYGGIVQTGIDIIDLPSYLSWLSCQKSLQDLHWQMDTLMTCLAHFSLPQLLLVWYTLQGKLQTQTIGLFINGPHTKHGRQ